MGQESDPVAEKGAGGDDDAESVEKKRTSDSSKVSKKGTAPDPDDKVIVNAHQN
eukprot:CAMPEP_0172158818 /NCGR_PEP_ID=MMETSP1050-20130122/4598_1 /TAXON_ID=233186 /ORGANISM="Cryptomonas curvata, Strain CCAP979/52" /LENGTH=53 /DNA_ID=CAMNT_0012828281 /DNA_START=694 /DNA_END=855 /DNA_ORIENTATION=+